MPRRSAVYTAVSLALVVALGAGCSRSRDAKPAEKPAEAGAARPLAAIWADMLTQRDAIHIVFLKDLEDVTHEDCAAVGASARKLDELTTELTNRLQGMSGEGEGRMRAIGQVITRMSSVFTKVRETALAEAPGAWVKLRYPLDQTLHEFETYFTAEDLGNETVMNRPGFETKAPPEALSAI